MGSFHFGVFGVSSAMCHGFHGADSCIPSTTVIGRNLSTLLDRKKSSVNNDFQLLITDLECAFFGASAR